MTGNLSQTGIAGKLLELSLRPTNAAGTSSPVYFTLDVVKRSQAITFPALNGMYLSSSNQSLAATSSSGLSVSYSIDPASTGGADAYSISLDPLFVGANLTTLTSADQMQLQAKAQAQAGLAQARVDVIDVELVFKSVAVQGSSGLAKLLVSDKQTSSTMELRLSTRVRID